MEEIDDEVSDTAELLRLLPPLRGVLFEFDLYGGSSWGGGGDRSRVPILLDVMRGCIDTEKKGVK